MLLPLIARVIGLKEEGKLCAASDIVDPNIYPIVLLIFNLDGKDISGMYVPDDDLFMIHNKDREMFDNVSKTDPIYIAALKVLDHFSECLATGGTINNERVNHKNVQPI